MSHTTLFSLSVIIISLLIIVGATNEINKEIKEEGLIYYVNEFQQAQCALDAKAAAQVFAEDGVFDILKLFNFYYLFNFFNYIIYLFMFICI